MSLDICARTLQEGDPERYLGAMLAPEGARAGLLGLYAFNLEIARAPWASAEEMIAEMRLQWWADALEDLFAGTPRPHPVMEPLAQALAAHDLPRPLLQEMVQARRFDIYRDSHPDRAAFDRYIMQTSGHVTELAARILGAKGAALPVVRDFAYGAGVANLLRALPELYARGRHPVPVACALDRNAVAGGQVPDNLAEALQEISRDALARLQSARRQRALVPKAARAALLAVQQPEIPLQIVAQNPAAALRGGMETSPFRKKSTMLWRSLTGRF